MSAQQDKKNKGFSLLMEDDMETSEKFRLSDAGIKTVEEHARYVSGKGKTYSWYEAKKIIKGKKKSDVLHFWWCT